MLQLLLQWRTLVGTICLGACVSPALPVGSGLGALGHPQAVAGGIGGGDRIRALRGALHRAVPAIAQGGALGEKACGVPMAGPKAPADLPQNLVRLGVGQTGPVESSSSWLQTINLPLASGQLDIVPGNY
eukprot:6720574-Karenia_brevis.AAC.1